MRISSIVQGIVLVLREDWKDAEGGWELEFRKSFGTLLDSAILDSLRSPRPAPDILSEWETIADNVDLSTCLCFNC